MGCLQSKNQEPASTDPAKATDDGHKKLHALLRPEIYKDKRPSFHAAYARAARRYGFEAGQYAGFAKRANVVVKVKGHHDKDTEHEVPAESIQNGTLSCLPIVVGYQLTFLSRVSMSSRHVGANRY